MADLAGERGLRDTALNDRVRNRRRPHDPPTLSRGTARELAGLMSRLARRGLSRSLVRVHGAAA